MSFLLGLTVVVQGSLVTYHIPVLNVFFTRALNDKLNGKPVIVNCVNPGYCYSSLRKNFKGARAWIDWIMEKALARTSEEGSRQLVWAALGGQDKPDDLRGAYISLAQVAEPSDYVIGAEGQNAQKKLWVCADLAITRKRSSLSC